MAVLNTKVISNEKQVDTTDFEQQQKNDELELVKADILNLNLSYLTDYLIYNKQWDRSEAIEAILQYKRFVFLMKKYEGIELPPSVDIDEVWHAHILHTKEYFEFSKEYFGKYLHHNPGKMGNLKTYLERKQYAESYQKKFDQYTQGLYQQEFGEKITTIRYLPLNIIFKNFIKKLFKKDI